MAKQTINQGTAPTGAGGDTFRTGSAKLQANDDEIYNYLGDGTNLNKLGTAATLTATIHNLDRTVGRVLKVQDFGVGDPIYLDSMNNMNQFHVNSMFFSSTAPANGWENGIFQTFRGNSTRFAQLGFNDQGGAFVRSGLYIANGATWQAIRTTGNTTVDANGFIKNASPVIQLFSNKIETNDEAQLQEITFEKLGAGDYLIKGSSGFAQEGWYIETPKDANGNLLVAVVYEQLANGDISVKTYDYMLNKKGQIIADIETPLDIPKGRWIDLRLQELPQPKIEVTDDPEQ